MLPLSTNPGLAGREKEDMISPQNSLGRTLQERLSEFYSSHCGIKEPEEKRTNPYGVPMCSPNSQSHWKLGFTIPFYR